MTFPHCPLCVALAVVSVLRATSNLALLGLRLGSLPGLSPPRPTGVRASRA